MAQRSHLLYVKSKGAVAASSSQSPAQTRQTLVFIDAVAAHGQAQPPLVRQIIRCSHRLVIAVTVAVTPRLFFNGAVTAHGQAQSRLVRQIIGCSHRLVNAVTGAVTPHLIF